MSQERIELHDDGTATVYNAQGVPLFLNVEETHQYYAWLARSGRGEKDDPWGNDGDTLPGSSFIAWR